MTVLQSSEGNRKRCRRALARYVPFVLNRHHLLTWHHVKITLVLLRQNRELYYSNDQGIVHIEYDVFLLAALVRPRRRIAM